MGCCCCRVKGAGGQTTLWIVRASNGEVLWRRPYLSESQSNIATAIDGEDDHYLTHRFYGTPTSAHVQYDDLDPRDVPFVTLWGSASTAFSILSHYDGMMPVAYPLSVSRTIGSTTTHFDYFTGVIPALASYPRPGCLTRSDTSGTDSHTRGLAWSVDPSTYPSGYSTPDAPAYLYTTDQLIPHADPRVTVVTEKRAIIEIDLSSTATHNATILTRLNCYQQSSFATQGTPYYHGGTIYELTHNGSVMLLRTHSPTTGAQLSSNTITGISTYNNRPWKGSGGLWVFSYNTQTLYEINGTSAASAALSSNQYGTSIFPPHSGPKSAFVCDDGSFVYCNGHLHRFAAGPAHAYTVTAPSIGFGLQSGFAFPYQSGRVVWNMGGAVRMYDTSGTEEWSLPNSSVNGMCNLPDGLILMAGNLPA